MKNLSVEFLQALRDWNRRVVLSGFQASRGLCVSLAAHLLLLIARRMVTVMSGLVFICIGLISPKAAWTKMHDVSLYEMLDYND